MNIAKLLMGNNDLIEQISKQFGLGNAESKSAIQALSSAVTGGIKKNTAKPAGLEALFSALKKGNHQQYVDNPKTLEKSETLQDGNNILGHIFGSKEVSREVAGRASQATGIQEGVLKKILPLVASVSMGNLSKQASSLGLSDSSALKNEKAVGGLLSFLDSDGDGSVIDDILGLVGKFK